MAVVPDTRSLQHARLRALADASREYAHAGKATSPASKRACTKEHSHCEGRRSEKTHVYLENRSTLVNPANASIAIVGGQQCIGSELGSEYRSWRG